MRVASFDMNKSVKFSVAVNIGDVACLLHELLAWRGPSIRGGVRFLSVSTMTSVKRLGSNMRLCYGADHSEELLPSVSAMWWSRPAEDLETQILRILTRVISRKMSIGVLSQVAPCPGRSN